MARATDPHDEAQARWQSGLKRLRERLGLTQRQLADMAGLAVGTYATIESGHDKVNLRVLERVAPILFGQELEALLLGDDGTTSAPSPSGRVTEDGVIVAEDTEGRFALSVTVDLKALGLRAGDVLIVDPAKAPSAGSVVAVRESFGARVRRLHLVRSLDPDGAPREMVQAEGPDVVFSPRHHEVIGTVANLIRDDPRFDPPA